MKFITEIMYSQLKNNENICISEYLNLDLFKKLHPYEYKDAIELDHIENKVFREKNKLKYFGELLERFDERGIVKDIHDLRTLVFVAVNILEKGGNYNSNQDTDFIENIISKMNNCFDYFTSATILQVSKESDYYDCDPLMLKILDEIESKNVDFEMAVYGIYSCFKFIDRRREKYFYYKEDLKREHYETMKVKMIKLFDDITLVPYGKDNMNGYSIYLMLSALSYDALRFAKSTDFKNKNTFKYLKSMSNMHAKEIGQDLSVNAAISNLGMDRSIIYFLNYLAVGYLGRGFRISENRFKKMKLKLWSFLNESYPIPEMVWNEIKDNIADQYASNKRGYTSYRSSDENVSTAIAGKVSRKNFDKLLSIESEIDFCKKGWVEYFFCNNTLVNKDLYEMLSYESKEQVVIKAIEDTEDKEVIKSYINILESYGLDITMVTDPILGSKIIDLEEDLETLKILGGKNIDILTRSLEKIRDCYDIDTYISYTIDILEGPMLVDISNAYKYGSYRVDSIYKFLYKEIISLNLGKIKDIRLKRHVQEIKDKIYIFKLSDEMDDSHIESYIYIVNNLKDNNYINLMELSNDDVLDILNYLEESIQVYMDKSQGYRIKSYEKYQALLKDVHILITKFKLDTNLDIEKCREFINEIRCINKISLEQKAKIDSIARFMIKSDEATIGDVRSLLIEINNKNKGGLLLDSDLLQIFKNGLLQLDN